jgi:FixJ family two-component response regulator
LREARENKSNVATPVPQVVVVDDDPMVRKSLGRLLATAGHEVRTFGSAKEFLDRSATSGPTCVLLDLRLPDLDGMELHRRLKEHAFGMQVVFMSGYGDIPITVEAMKAGAFDFLTKPVTEGRLLSVVEAALVEASKGYVEAEQSRDVVHRFESLTRREREVLQLVVAGRLNKQIARELKISEKTVKVHRGRVMQKMGTRRVAELVRIALRLGLKAPLPAQRPEVRERVGA